MGLAEVKTLALSLGGLIHGHDFQEASGTVLDDFSTSALDSTLGTRGALGAAPLLPDATSALQSNGAAGSGAAATRAATGTVLQTLTEFTIVMLVSQSAWAASRGIIERSNVWGVRTVSNGQLLGTLTLGGVAQTNIQTFGKTPLSTPTLVAYSFKSPFSQFWLNGAPDVKSNPMTGALSIVSTVAVTFGIQSGSTFQGSTQLSLIFNRELSGGEHRELAATADVSLDRLGGVFFDFPQDDEPVIASTPQVAYDHVAGGKMRAGEAYHLPAGTARRRMPTMRRLEALGRPVLDGSSTQDDWAARALGHGLERLMALAFRPNTTRATYRSASAWVGATGDQPGNFAGLGAMAAIMARYVTGGPRGLRGYASPDPLIQLARSDLAYLYGLSSLPTNYHMGSGDFSLCQFGQLVLALDGLIPRAEWEGYRDDYLAFIEYFASTEGEETYYVNGNREMAEHLMYVLGNLWDPVAWPDSRLDDHWDFVTAPLITANGAGGLQMGFREIVAPVASNGSDGRGYLAENHGGNAGKGLWNWGGTVGPGGSSDVLYETVDVDGLSKEYVNLATQFSTIAWLISRAHGLAGEARLERITNMMRNQVRVDTNTSTWVVDAAYGSRHVDDFTWNSSVDRALAFTGSRVDLSAAEMASQWTAFEAKRRTDYRTPDQGLYRDAPYEVGQVLQAHDDYPWS